MCESRESVDRRERGGRVEAKASLLGGGGNDGGGGDGGRGRASAGLAEEHAF